MADKLKLFRIRHRESGEFLGDRRNNNAFDRYRGRIGGQIFSKESSAKGSFAGFVSPLFPKYHDYCESNRRNVEGTWSREQLARQRELYREYRAWRKINSPKLSFEEMFPKYEIVYL